MARTRVSENTASRLVYVYGEAALRDALTSGTSDDAFEAKGKARLTRSEQSTKSSPRSGITKMPAPLRCPFHRSIPPCVNRGMLARREKIPVRSNDIHLGRWRPSWIVQLSLLSLCLSVSGFLSSLQVGQLTRFFEQFQRPLYAWLEAELQIIVSGCSGSRCV